MPDGGEFDLKTIVRPIILAQGNTYIKELLREHKIKIGATKADFEKNMFDAIDGGQLTLPMVEAWLLKVEGWGDQHVYVLIPPAPAAFEVVKGAIQASKHSGLLEVGISYAFPAQLAMTSVRLSPELLAVDWHIGMGAWERAKSKDFQKEIDGELYEFRAHRDRSDRSVVRFEWRFGQPYSCLFTQLPNDGDKHDQILKQVFTDLAGLGAIAEPLQRVPLSQAVKASTQDKRVVAHSTRMTATGGYVDLVSTLADGGIADVEAIRRVRQGVQDSDFGSAEGVLSFPRAKHGTLSRDVSG